MEKLVYVDDALPGITRRRVGKGWAYYDPSGALIREAREKKRLNAIALPPAYKDAWFCPAPNGHILATGYDDAGRKQYRYHPDFRARQDSAKYDACASFGKLLPLVLNLQASSRLSSRQFLGLRSFCPNRHRRQGLRLLSANISTWGPQFEAFLFSQAACGSLGCDFDVIVVQEHHLLAEQLRVAAKVARRAGYRLIGSCGCQELWHVWRSLVVGQGLHPCLAGVWSPLHLRWTH
jgi:hypothetical protein